MNQAKHRSLLLAIWLGLSLMGSAITCVLLLLLNFSILDAPTYAAGGATVPTWLLWVYLVLATSYLVCIIAIVRWKKWGFWGLCLLAAPAFVVQFVSGDANGSTGIGSLVILFVLLKIGGETNGWDQLE